jgi:TonB-linked SusC/RagA family outer membrane protein
MPGTVFSARRGATPVRSGWGGGGWVVALLASAFLGVLPLEALAQNQIGGTVVDATTNQPLAGAQVSIQGTSQGALSQANGRFLLLNVAQSTVTLEVVMLGYVTWTGQVDRGRVDVDVRLEPRALELDAIVVTGTAGAQQARALGNTVGRVDGAGVTQVSPLATVESLLNGAVPGVNVAVGGGEVGTGSNIRIRGASSISLNSQPLVYVDGVRVNGDNADVGGGRGGVGIDNSTPPSRLNDINPNDIESIEIIKGPAAATLYGTEASNGVINIITKRGSRGAPNFSLSVKQGANWLPDPETYFPNTYFRCAGTSGTCNAGEVTAFSPLAEDRIRYGYNWFQTGRPQGYAASVSGGTDDLRYYFSADWDRDEGVVDYNWQNQFRGRANLNWTPHETFDVNFGIGGVLSNYKSASANQPVTTAILWSCFGGCEAGSGANNPVDGPARGYIGYLPEVLADSVDGYQAVARQTYSFTATHRPTSWLTHRLTWGGDFTDTNNTELYRPIKGPGHFQPQGSKTAMRQSTTYLSLDYSGTATYAPTDDLEFQTSGGVQYYSRASDWIYSRGSNFPVATLETVSSGSIKDAAEDFVENKTLGAYVQEQISWQDRLFLTVAARGDDNSAFGQNFDFVVYPKFSASWVVSEEPFFRNQELLQALRLRAAWGQAGQQPDVFAALRTYAPAVGPGGASTLRPQNIGNENLEPEVGTELEFGFDASFLDDRLGVEFTYYDQSRDKALIQVPVKPSLGFPGAQFQNIGQITNSGMELGIRAALARRDNWNLDLDVSLSTNSNEIASMGGLGPQILNASNPTTGWAGQYYAEGFPLGSIFLKRVVSADITGSGATAAAANVLCEGGSVIANTPNLSRGGGSAVPCAEAPYIFQGSPIPTRELSTGLTLTLFDDLQLFTQFDYQGGHNMVNGTAAGAHLFFRVTREILERDDPILLGYESLGADGINQAGLIDASFLKLRRIAATWTVPQNFTNSIGAERLTLTLAGHNLWTVWQATPEVFGYPIRDPEQRDTGASGSDPGGLHAYIQEAWPPIRRLMLTARVNF